MTAGDGSKWARIIRVDPGVLPWKGRPSVADLAIAGVATAMGIGGVIAEVLSAGRAPESIFGGAAAAVLAGAALLWRRRAPLLVALVILGGCLLYHVFGYPGLAPAVAMYPAVYTVAAYATGRRLWLAGALIVAVGVIPVLPPLPATYDLGALLGPEIAMVAAVAVGETTRTRQAASLQQLRAAQRAAAEQQRRRLLEQRLDVAREVHDLLAHTITVITVQAAAAADALEERPEDARAALTEVRRAARDASAELHGTLRLLRGETDATTGPLPGAVGTRQPGTQPAVTPPQPGLAQLPELARQARVAGIEATLEVAGEPTACSPSLQLAVYRVVQEALTNTVRHSGAATASVIVDLGRDEIRVEITDDGTGTHQAAPINSGGHGLIGMRERVQAFGGSLDAAPTQPPRSGFRVLARLPTHNSQRLPASPHGERSTALDTVPCTAPDPAPGGGDSR